jgi:hypothetical protein
MIVFHYRADGDPRVAENLLSQLDRSGFRGRTEATPARAMFTTINGQAREGTVTFYAVEHETIARTIASLTSSWLNRVGMQPLRPLFEKGRRPDAIDVWVPASR